MKKKLIVFSIILIGLFLTTFITVKLHTQTTLDNEINSLLASEKNNPEKKFSYTQLHRLPEPVQRYFKYAMKDGQPYIDKILIKHDGEFRLGPEKDWGKITGIQYYSTAKPGFVWHGKMQGFLARDMFLNDYGRLTVYLFSAFKIIDGSGPAYDQGELLRWLGECIWFPTALLPNKNLSWSGIDNNNALLTYNYKNITIKYNVEFNARGEITTLTTKRYMDGKRLETWVGRCSNYKELNNIKIPTFISASWMLDTGEFCYAKFNLTNVDYNFKIDSK